MLSMTFQPPAYDSGISTVWDLAQFNVVMQGGIIQSGRMTFNCYSQAANAGNPAKVLYQKSYNLTAAEVAAFQTANNIPAGQQAALAYGLAKSIADCATAGVDAAPAQNATPVSFFAGATKV